MSRSRASRPLCEGCLLLARPRKLGAAILGRMRSLAELVSSLLRPCLGSIPLLRQSGSLLRRVSCGNEHLSSAQISPPHLSLREGLSVFCSFLSASLLTPCLQINPNPLQVLLLYRLRDPRVLLFASSWEDYRHVRRASVRPAWRCHQRCSLHASRLGGEVTTPFQRSRCTARVSGRARRAG